MSDKPASDPLLRIIAIFKLAKACLCICIGFGLLHYLNKDIEERLINLMNHLHVDSDNHIPKWILTQAGLLSKQKMEALSAIAFFYGALFATEGTGLYLRKRWGEWLVVVITGSLLPLEFYEIVHHVTMAKIALTIGNLIILGYLIVVIRRKKE